LVNTKIKQVKDPAKHAQQGIIKIKQVELFVKHAQLVRIVLLENQAVHLPQQRVRSVRLPMKQQRAIHVKKASTTAK